MLMLTMMSLLILTLVLTMMMINSIISKKTFIDREKSSPFECGFDPKSSPRISFSLHFFLISIVFLVFDIEIALILPLILTMKMSSILTFSLLFNFFLIILLLGVFHEWKQGALNWTQ